MLKCVTVISLIIAALVCYLAGSVTGTVLFGVAGVGLELLFYFEAFGLMKR